MPGPARTITPMPRRNASIAPARTVSDLGGRNRVDVERDTILAAVLAGKTNNTNVIDLDASGTTVISDPRIGQTTFAVLQGINQNGSASIPTISQAVTAPGEITLTHAASGLTRTVAYALFG